MYKDLTHSHGLYRGGVELGFSRKSRDQVFPPFHYVYLVRRSEPGEFNGAVQFLRLVGDFYQTSATLKLG